MKINKRWFLSCIISWIVFLFMFFYKAFPYLQNGENQEIKNYIALFVLAVATVLMFFTLYSFKEGDGEEHDSSTNGTEFR